MIEVHPDWKDACPKKWRIMVDEYAWTGRPGFCIATDATGDMRFDVERDEAGDYTVVYSERSYA